jgi:hypothetical protein
MYPSERPSSYGGNRPHSHRQHQQHGNRQQVPEETIRTERIQIERKSFIFTLKENPRGRFLRITEDVNGRRDNIIIPTTGLEEFSDLVDEMLKTSQEVPEENGDAE